MFVMKFCEPRPGGGPGWAGEQGAVCTRGEMSRDGVLEGTPLDLFSPSCLWGKFRKQEGREADHDRKFGLAASNQKNELALSGGSCS